jgi:hypothetical protein
MIYPLTRVGSTPSTDMPAAVRELYEEAASVVAISRRPGQRWPAPPSNG